MSYLDMSDLDYLKLDFKHKFIYKFIMFFVSIGRFFKRIGLKIWNGIKLIGLKITELAKLIVFTFKDGSWKTRVSYLIFGFGNFTRKQWFKGALFLIFEVIFIVYMITTGGYWLSKWSTLGTVRGGQVYDEVTDSYIWAAGDDSFKCLLY